MTDAPPDNPGIDFTRIDFPSNRLTLQQLKGRTYDSGAPFSFEEDGPGLDGMLGVERLLAELGFLRALGIPSALEEARHVEDLLEDPQESRESLARGYVLYGVADGPATAQEFVKRLGAMGAAQAAAFAGRSQSAT